MDDTTREALSTLRSIITLPDQRDLGFPVDVVEKALEAATADNAALMQRAQDALSIATEQMPMPERQAAAHAALADLLAQPHPGAPLLARIGHVKLTDWLRTAGETMATYEEEGLALRRYILGEEP